MIADADIPKVVDALIYAIQHPLPRDPSLPAKDRLGREFKVGEKVAVALGNSCHGPHLDFGRIDKIDTAKDRLLINWDESPIRTYDVRWDKKQNKYVECKRRKSWVCPLNAVAVS